MTAAMRSDSFKRQMSRPLVEAIKLFFTRPRRSYTVRDLELLTGVPRREARKIVAESISAGELRPVRRSPGRFSRAAVEQWLEQRAFYPPGLLARLLAEDQTVEQITLSASLLRSILAAGSRDRAIRFPAPGK